MKKILCLLMTLLFTNSSLCQVSDQYKEYFANFITNLDPLEGIYSSRFFVQDRGNGYAKRWGETSEVVIKKDIDGNLYIIGNKQITIKRIGETNAYNVFAKWPAATASCRAYLVDGVSFNYEYQLPEAQLRYERENINNIIVFGGELIKIYPTASMYAEVIKKAQEEAQPTEWTGTGFSLKDNYIVTNYHVVEGAKSISVLGINGSFSKGYSAEVVATDKYNDLAILKVYGITISSANIPYSVKTNTAEVGEEVFVLGYPLTSTMGEEIKLTTGVVSSRSGFQGDVSLYQISAPIQPGNSGGPLFDSKGNVIGIVSAKHTGAENVGYAIKTSCLKNLIESSISTNILPQTNKISSLNLSGKVKSAKNFVYYIVCSSSSSNTIISKQPHTENEVKTSPSINHNLNKAIEYTESASTHYYRQEYAAAVELLQKAVDLGYHEAQYKLGYMYQHGEGVKRNVIKALELYKKAASNGNRKACCNIGYIYEMGELVKKDLTKAVEWYVKAADLGEPVAQNNLGHFYFHGRGVTKNYIKALEFYQKAAVQGNSEAQYMVGYIYENGFGVKKDYHKAVEWYKKSADQGDEDAKEALKRMEK